MEQSIVFYQAREQLLILQDTANNLLTALSRLSEDHTNITNTRAQNLVLHGNHALQNFHALISQLVSSKNSQTTADAPSSSIPTAIKQLWNHLQYQQKHQQQFPPQIHHPGIPPSTAAAAVDLPPTPPTSPASSLYQLMKSLRQRLDMTLVNPVSIKHAHGQIRSITVKFSSLFKAHIVLEESNPLIPRIIQISSLHEEAAYKAQRTTGDALEEIDRFSAANNARCDVAYSDEYRGRVYGCSDDGLDDLLVCTLLAQHATQAMHIFCSLSVNGATTMQTDVEEQTAGVLEKKIHPLEMLLLWLACCMHMFRVPSTRDGRDSNDANAGNGLQLQSLMNATVDPISGYLIPNTTLLAHMQSHLSLYDEHAIAIDMWSELWKKAIYICPRRHPKAATPLFMMLFDTFAEEETLLPAF